MGASDEVVSFLMLANSVTRRWAAKRDARGGLSVPLYFLSSIVLSISGVYVYVQSRCALSRVVYRFHVVDANAELRNDLPNRIEFPTSPPPQPSPFSPAHDIESPEAQATFRR